MIHSGGFMQMSRRIVMAVGLSLVLVAPQSFAAQETGKVSVVDSGKIIMRLTDLQNDHTSLRVGFVGVSKKRTFVSLFTADSISLIFVDSTKVVRTLNLVIRSEKRPTVPP